MSTMQLSNALYSSAVQIPFMANSGFSVTNVGNKGGRDIGLCSSHPSSSQAPDPHRAKISAAAFFLDAYLNNSMNCALSQNAVYGEYNDHAAEYHFFCDGSSIQTDKPLPPSYQLIPAILYAVFFAPNLNVYFDAFKNDPSLDNSLRFCDCFWYDYAKPKDKITLEEGLDTGQIKTAYRTGALLDRSDTVGGNGCSLFKDVKQRTSGTSSIAGLPQDIFDRIRRGEYHIDHEWDSCQEGRIRPLSSLEDFVPTDAFYKALKKVDFRIRKKMSENVSLGVTDIDSIKQDFVNILLWGDPGTGKTVLANAIAAVTGMPIYEIIFNEDSEDDEFEGKNKIVEGKLSFVETAFLEAFEKGGIILMEEINLARANVFTSVINQAMEYPYILNRNGYKRVTRNPFTIVIGTMNLDTEGTSAVNSSSAQRFLSKYEVTAPSDNEFMAVLKSRGFFDKDIRYVYAAYKKICNDLRSSEQKKRYLKELSVRQCISALSSIEEGIEPKEAIMDSMYGSLAIKNKKVADTINNSIICNLVDYDSFH